MKIMIDVPDRLVDVCRSMIGLMTDDDDVESMNQVDKALDEMKDSVVELDMSSLSSGKGKELSIGLVCLAVSQRMKDEKG